MELVLSEKIVVLDGYTTTPLAVEQQPDLDTDVTWDPLKALGDLRVYDRTGADEIIQRIDDAPIVLTNKTRIDADIFEACSGLEYVGVLATGVNVVDLAAAKAKGITVANVPGYSTASVAQHVFALLLELTNHTGDHDRATHSGQWVGCKDFSFTLAPLMELNGMTLGIIGMGAIGQAVANIGHAFGMKIVANSRTKKNTGVPIDWLAVDQLFQVADVVTLHCPLTPETERIASEERLYSMKPGSYLINTGRGQLIDEEAVFECLSDGTLAGVGLDVMSQEPPDWHNPLMTVGGCIITPHIAWASVASRRRLLRIAADNVSAYLDGKPVNVVS